MMELSVYVNIYFFIQFLPWYCAHVLLNVPEQNSGWCSECLSVGKMAPGKVDG